MNKHEFRGSSRRCIEIEAFSLVELLVVVGIIAVLMSILLPALARVRGRADQATCMSNARQLIFAWNMYCHDFNDNLPPNMDGILGGFTNWVAGNMANVLDALDSKLLMDHRRSLLYPYLTHPGIFKCPADESRLVRSVSMNCRLNPTRLTGQARWIGGSGKTYRTFTKLAAVKTPASVFVTIDESATSINDAYFAVVNEQHRQYGWIRTTEPVLLDRHSGWLSLARRNYFLRRWSCANT